MQKRHRDRKAYFNEQAITTRKYVIPYIKKYKSISNLKVLEIGCGEGGNLLPFLEENCQVIGLDLASDKIQNGKEYLTDYIQDGSCQLLDCNIFFYKTEQKFDLIFYRDVIEHIPDHIKLLNLTSELLADDGLVMIAFPPWQNPFGGHQQMLKSQILSKIPYIHLLPQTIYRNMMENSGERQVVINELLDLNNSKLSVESFKKEVKHSDLKLIDLQLYFINPNYEIKFNLKPRLQSKIIAKIPHLRNFLSTTCYAILKGKK